MTKITDLHNTWMQDSEYHAAYDALEDEFALASALIEAQSRVATSCQQPELLKK